MLACLVSFFGVVVISKADGNKSRAIHEGRQAAREIDLYLEKCTGLPVCGGIFKTTPQEVAQAMGVEQAA